MICFLPEALEVGGQQIAINADFRNVLTIFEAFDDPEITKEEKAIVCLARLYAGPLPYYHIEEAYKKAVWFLDGGDLPKSDPEGARLIDWNHDGSMIFPAVSKVLGTIDVRSLPFLHWWTFLGSFGEVGEGLLSTVLNLRQKRSRGEKLTKSEERFWRKNKKLCRITTPEEQAAIDETEEFLKTLI